MRGLMTALCVKVIRICLSPMPNVKSLICSAFWHLLVFEAPNKYHGDCPSPTPSWAVSAFIMFSPYVHIFHCSTHCICLCDVPGFINSAFCLAKLPDPAVLLMYRTAYMKHSGTRLWSRMGIRSVQILLMGF